MGPMIGDSPASRRALAASSGDCPPTLGTVTSLPLMVRGSGEVKSRSGSHCSMTFIASPHIGPASVLPCAASMYLPPIVWPFRLIQWPRLFAPAIIEAVARSGV